MKRPEVDRFGFVDYFGDEINMERLEFLADDSLTYPLWCQDSSVKALEAYTDEVVKQRDALMKWIKKALCKSDVRSLGQFTLLGYELHIEGEQLLTGIKEATNE